MSAVPQEERKLPKCSISGFCEPCSLSKHRFVEHKTSDYHVHRFLRIVPIWRRSIFLDRIFSEWHGSTKELRNWLYRGHASLPVTLFFLSLGVAKQAVNCQQSYLTPAIGSDPRWL